MPTGYTASVCDGEVTNFRTFALQCSRAFGAVMHQRDDPQDALPQEQPEEDSYYSKALTKAKAELRRLQELTPNEYVPAYNKYYLDAIKSARESREKAKLVKDRLRSMLEATHKWEPPTEDHQGLKEFMLEQIMHTIDFEWDGTPDPERELPEVWHAKQIEQATKDIAYYTENLAKSRKRISEANQWIRDLYKSL
jgi:hypothetical protein